MNNEPTEGIPEHCYELTYENIEGDLGQCYASGLTIADVDERFGKEYGDNTVLAIQLLGPMVEL